MESGGPAAVPQEDQGRERDLIFSRNGRNVFLKLNLNSRSWTGLEDLVSAQCFLSKILLNSKDRNLASLCFL